MSSNSVCIHTRVPLRGRPTNDYRPNWTPFSPVTITNNVDFKSVWYRFGSLTNTIDRSNRIMADLFLDHYYKVSSINTDCQ